MIYWRHHWRRQEHTDQALDHDAGVIIINQQCTAAASHVRLDVLIASAAQARHGPQPIACVTDASSISESMHE